jgi:hypothetical protein
MFDGIVMNSKNAEEIAKGLDKFIDDNNSKAVVLLEKEMNDIKEMRANNKSQSEIEDMLNKKHKCNMGKIDFILRVYFDKIEHNKIPEGMWVIF